ncbi:MAG: aryl-sulfate sulfotransferase [Bacteroidota bacterium]|nr:aryl-sulfate sulfotransferase [Bacteroidota bacterium]
MHIRGVVYTIALLLLAHGTQGQQRTVGLFTKEAGVSDGYVLFAPLRSNTTYLIDNNGRQLHSWWSAAGPALSVYLLENGLLARAEYVPDPKFWGGGTGGRIKFIDWDGEVQWQYEYVSAQHVQHHDFEVLPNGNVLVIAWEQKSMEEALAAGRLPNWLTEQGIWALHIVELQPRGPEGADIVWEWHVWDHLVQDFDANRDNFGVVAAHPELVDINYSGVGTDVRSPDLCHANSIDYNAALDQIVISVRHYSELWVIDHSTTTAEAAGHSGGRAGKGGDLLYRWGNPQVYKAGDEDTRRLHWQHDAQWIADGLPGAGNMLVFDNGIFRPAGDYSSVVEIRTPVDSLGQYALPPGEAYAPADPLWEFIAPTPEDFFARSMSGAQRLPNGNTLICDAPYGIFFEVTPDGEEVWRYVNPVTQDGPLRQGESIGGTPTLRDNQTFRCIRYPTDYPGFEGRTLTPGDPIERYPAVDVDPVAGAPERPEIRSVFPQPADDEATLLYHLPAAASIRLAVYNMLGEEVAVLSAGRRAAGLHAATWRTDGVPPGLYVARLQGAASTAVRTLLVCGH